MDESWFCLDQEKAKIHYEVEDLVNWIIFESESEDPDVIQWRTLAKELGVTRIRLTPKETLNENP